MSDTMPPSSVIPDEDILDIEDQLEQYKKGGGSMRIEHACTPPGPGFGNTAYRQNDAQRTPNNGTQPEFQDVTYAYKQCDKGMIARFFLLSFSSSSLLSCSSRNSALTSAKVLWNRRI
jgi:hypothetical protein